MSPGAAQQLPPPTPVPIVYAGPTAADLARIPDELKRIDTWVLFRLREEISKDNKVQLKKPPINPRTLRGASHSDPDTWGTFDECLAKLPDALEQWRRAGKADYRGGGIGFVLTAKTGIALVDLDKCLDPATNVVESWAIDIVKTLTSYTQGSVSRTGLHVLVRGTIPPGEMQEGRLQMWDHARYVAMTGWHADGTPATVEARQSQLTMVHKAAILLPKAQTTAPTPPPRQGQPASLSGPPRMSDSEIIRRASEAENSRKFLALWSGDISKYRDDKGRPDQNRADEALCCELVFWTHDPEQIDRLFRQSGLVRPKWEERADYRERTIDHAFDTTLPNFYNPSAYATTNGTRRHRQRTALTSDQAQASDQAGTQDQPQDQPQAGDQAGDQAKRLALPWSDYTNARAMLEDDHGNDLRYCWDWGRWLVWTDTHWHSENPAQVRQWAKATIKKMVLRVPYMEENKIVPLAKHIKRSLSTAAIKAMIESAQDEPGIPVLPAALDTNLWLLNCANGTLDLRTGGLQPHTRADLLTRCLATPYTPTAQCPQWDKFLWRIMGGTIEPDNPDLSSAQLEERQKADDRAGRLIGFLQRAAGYALTGDTSEECLFILHGDGRNGKSKFLEALEAVLEDYAQSTPVSTLLAKDRHDGIPNDLAALRGARFVTLIEISEGKRLDEQLVKRLTGRDPVKARFLYQEYFEFRPEFKLFMAVNHLPKIHGTDNAIWERVFRVPFDVYIPLEERDKDLPAKLRAELPGILRWAVQGCLEWQNGGLRPPPEVTASTEAYRTSQDVVGRFIEECCLVSPNVQGKASELFTAFQKWCDTGGEYAGTSTAFGIRLEKRGFERKKISSVRYLGIGLLSDN